MVFKKSRGGGSSRAALQCLGKEMVTEVAVRISLFPLRDCSVVFTNSLLPGM